MQRILLTMAMLPALLALHGTAAGLEVRNGWYVHEGKVVWGNAQYNGWWGAYRTNITRNAPGMIGPNRTEDLEKLSDAMLRFGYPALEHNYGLWYDRRRDRHDVGRRTDDEVVPPLLEQPWARSREGSAWDGRSKYDLEKYNDWYFDRLDEFASICDRKGTLLLHSFYMQHALLETDAHYVDFPWRPVNCIQKTGMPDRIPAANSFYDVSHPVRRRLHEAYIRKCLDVLGRHENVIMLCSQEFTGPLSFLNFWIDTILDWEKETGRRVHIAAGGCKDVLDAVLADPVRGPRMATIDLRYWWYLPDGTLDAPPGGREVAGRYASGRGSAETTPEQIYRQIREYRERHPKRGILHMINGSRQQTWAFLMGGGSILVRYLQSAEEKETRYVAPEGIEPVRKVYEFVKEHLAERLPDMRPADLTSDPERNWCLASPGGSYLVYLLRGGKVRLDLSSANGRFRARWLDPRTGTLTEAESSPVSAGKTILLEAPGPGDQALWLQRVAAETSPESAATTRESFLEARTVFQTNLPWDPRLALAVDGVIVHRHGDGKRSLSRAITSWQEKGYLTGRMFFADSDAANAYWTGKWDGTPHPEDVERDAKGDVVKCAGVRPYMLPTEGWIRYLEEMTGQSIEAGADAILPEEPLAHAHTGYEKSFRQLWVERYGKPWEPESASAEARFLTAQLKNELYVKLERRLAALTRTRARDNGTSIPFVLPVHSIYSNVAARLVAPLGTSLGIEHVNGMIGQVWTGPVRWALHHYGSPEKSFFTSAYALYDYFVALTAGTGRQLWLLSDPVEDDPKHEWAEFEEWYRHCVTAKLLFPDVSSFEVMPWPDRIFLPGYGTGGGTPAPGRNRIAILSAVQVQQEIPAAGSHVARITEGIGVALADTLLWEKEPFPPLDGVYGLILPLLNAGVPVTACLLERTPERGYLSRFRVIVLSYEAFKPLRAEYHAHLAAWVRRGGSLIVLGAPDDLDGAALWWRKAGHPSPLHHLLAELGPLPAANGDHSVGEGLVLRRGISPRRFADPDTARGVYLPLVDHALREQGIDEGLRRPGYFLLRRGPFVVAHAVTKPLEIPGKLVDIFEPELPVVDGARLEAGMSGLYRDVTEVLAEEAETDRVPCVLHCTHRRMKETRSPEALEVTLRGPLETPAVVRIHTAGRKPESVSARGAEGKNVPVDRKREGTTLRLRFPNDPGGVTLVVRWR